MEYCPRCTRFCGTGWAQICWKCTILCFKLTACQNPWGNGSSLSSPGRRGQRISRIRETNHSWIYITRPYPKSLLTGSSLHWDRGSTTIEPVLYDTHKKSGPYQWYPNPKILNLKNVTYNYIQALERDEKIPQMDFLKKMVQTHTTPINAQC